MKAHLRSQAPCEDPELQHLPKSQEQENCLTCTYSKEMELRSPITQDVFTACIALWEATTNRGKLTSMYNWTQLEISPNRRMPQKIPSLHYTALHTRQVVQGFKMDISDPRSQASKCLTMAIECLLTLQTYHTQSPLPPQPSPFNSSGQTEE